MCTTLIHTSAYAKMLHAGYSASAKRVGLFYVLVLNICLSMAWAYNQSLFVSILSYKLHLVPYPYLQSQVHVLIVNECLMHVMVVL